MRSTALTTFTGLGLAAVAAFGLTACGSDSGDSGGSGSDKTSQAPGSKKPGPAKEPFAGLSGKQISDKAEEATKSASSLRIKGSGPNDDGGRITMDLALDRQGRCAGTIGMADQGSADLVRTGSTLYMKYDEDFVRALGKTGSKAETDAMVQMLAGRWVKMNAKSPDAKEFDELCDLDNMLSDLTDGDDDGDKSVIRRGKATTLDGTPAFTLDSKDKDGHGTLYIATEGKPYLLKADGVDKKNKPLEMTFTDYDKPVRANPPAGKVLDLDALSKLGT
ncbi:hypothetical protein ACQB60_13015 [Actinomycetota bacterium Odt1-20B]